VAGDPTNYGPILDVAQVAQLLRLDPQTIRSMVNDGRLKASRLPGSRKFLFKLDDILALIDENVVQPDDNVDADLG